MYVGFDFVAPHTRGLPQIDTGGAHRYFGYLISANYHPLKLRYLRLAFKATKQHIVPTPE
jgi:hypothetical protein